MGFGFVQYRLQVTLKSFVVLFYFVARNDTV